jgi:hypothetical protein
MLGDDCHRKHIAGDVPCGCMERPLKNRAKALWKNGNVFSNDKPEALSKSDDTV